MARKHRMPIDSGYPDGFQYMHPTMIRNFGRWRYHTHPRVGVLCHIAEMPSRVHITTSRCRIDCGGQGDSSTHMRF